MAMNPTTWTAAKRKAQSKKIKAAWKRRKEAEVQKRDARWRELNHLEPMQPQQEPMPTTAQYAYLRKMDLKYNPHFEEECDTAPHLTIPDILHLEAARPIYEKHFGKADAVNHPAHYTATKYEAADVADEWYANEPHLWNANKYMVRWDKKGDPVENLEKAIWYIQRKISKLKEK